MPSWMVLQKPGSGYRDVEGQCYEYPSHIPHAKRGRWLSNLYKAENILRVEEEFSELEEFYQLRHINAMVLKCSRPTMDGIETFQWVFHSMKWVETREQNPALSIQWAQYLLTLKRNCFLHYLDKLQMMMLGAQDQINRDVAPSPVITPPRVASGLTVLEDGWTKWRSKV